MTQGIPLCVCFGTDPDASFQTLTEIRAEETPVPCEEGILQSPYVFTELVRVPYVVDCKGGKNYSTAAHLACESLMLSVSATWMICDVAIYPRL